MLLGESSSPTNHCVSKLNDKADKKTRIKLSGNYLYVDISLRDRALLEGSTAEFLRKQDREREREQIVFRRKLIRSTKNKKIAKCN